MMKYIIKKSDSVFKNSNFYNDYDDSKCESTK